MEIAERIGVDEVKALARSMPVEELFRQMKTGSTAARRNAAWALTHKSDQEIVRLPKEEMINLVLTTESTPLRRLTLSLIERQPLKEEDLRIDFLDFCLIHMVMLEEPPGVQSLCMKIAQRMCAFYPELTHEFQETLRLMQVESYKPSLQSVIRKLQK